MVGELSRVLASVAEAVKIWKPALEVVRSAQLGLTDTLLDEVEAEPQELERTAATSVETEAARASVGHQFKKSSATDPMRSAMLAAVGETHASSFDDEHDREVLCGGSERLKFVYVEETRWAP